MSGQRRDDDRRPHRQWLRRTGAHRQSTGALAIFARSSSTRPAISSTAATGRTASSTVADGKFGDVLKAGRRMACGRAAPDPDVGHDRQSPGLGRGALCGNAGIARRPRGCARARSRSTPPTCASCRASGPRTPARRRDPWRGDADFRRARGSRASTPAAFSCRARIRNGRSPRAARSRASPPT